MRTDLGSSDTNLSTSSPPPQDSKERVTLDEARDKNRQIVPDCSHRRKISTAGLWLTG
ncbi:MAG: hypothetical protein WKF73_22105 [Nocardioidaceae bacterium]